VAPDEARRNDESPLVFFFPEPSLVIFRNFAKSGVYDARNEVPNESLEPEKIDDSVRPLDIELAFFFDWRAMF
jgi:hypothetical protein